MHYSNEEKLKALKRELRFRRQVYGRKVDEGSMTREFADEQIAIFEAIATDYENLCKMERLL